MPPVDAAGPNPATVTATEAASEPAAATGLTSAEAADRLREDGPNTIGGSGRRTRLAILVAQVASPLVLILVGASLVSLVVGDVINASIIIAIVVMSAALGFVQEARSESAVAALQARLTLRATVVRDGTEQELPIHDVVRGDLVALSAGDSCRPTAAVIEANHLYVDEASLTGESAPATKTAREGALDPARDEDRDGLLFFGTSGEISSEGSCTSTGGRHDRVFVPDGVAKTPIQGGRFARTGVAISAKCAPARGSRHTDARSFVPHPDTRGTFPIN